MDKDGSGSLIQYCLVGRTNTHRSKCLYQTWEGASCIFNGNSTKVREFLMDSRVFKMACVASSKNQVMGLPWWCSG